MKATKIARLILFTALILFGFSCTRGIKVETKGEKIELSGFRAVEGQHCESTSIMNALNYQGVPLSEAMINGLAGSISFVFVTEGGFPFLGARTMSFLENLTKVSGLKPVTVQPKTSQEAYDEAKKVLKRGIPVILRVDMRYLPYRWNGEYGDEYTSFGWHFVTLIKLDETTGDAWITENAGNGVRSIEKIRITDLMKARNSKEGMLKADNFFYYFQEPQQIKIDTAEALKSSLDIVVDNYRKKEGVLAGLQRFPGQIRDIESLISTRYVLEPLFFTFHGYIETFGTGGAAFRIFYRDFLLESGRLTNNPEIIHVASLAGEAAKKWGELAVAFKSISENIRQYYGDQKKRESLYLSASGLAEELYLAESRFAEGLEKLLKTL